MGERRPRLAIVGASVRGAAFSALRGGFEAVAADMFADADLARHVEVTQIDPYPAGLPAWLEGIDCDAWLYTGALENHAELVDALGRIKPLVGNTAAALRVLRDPQAMRRAADAAGLGSPEICTQTPTPQRGEAWLCKTYRGASGTGVWRLDGAEAAERARREGAVLQRYVAGEPASAIFVVSANAAALLGVTRQLLRGGEHPWQYVGSVGPLVCSPAIEGQLAGVGKMLHGLGARGIVGVDLVLADERAWIIEINPRYTASVEILERYSGTSAVAAHVAACDPGLAMQPPAASAAATGQVYAKRILFASRDVQVSRAFHDWAMERSSLELRECLLADIPHAGEVILAGRPVLTVFGVGGVEADAIGELAQRVGEVERRLYDG